ncbi:MAG TPA: hypothetical protein DCW90_22925 [Lachnospiraceae bacterium]|nr:hypothetical protein [Lachnospiraceae bacterium]
MMKHNIIACNKSENCDYLTGLLNRRGLHEIWQSLSPCDVLHGIFIDIDNFKMVNDIYGHAKGDDLLIFVSRLLKNLFNEQLAVRLGGDEFFLLCNGSLTKQEIEQHLSKLQLSLQSSNFDENILMIISLSIGIICNITSQSDLNEILQECDEAMYHAKKNGKGHWVFFEDIEPLFHLEKTIREQASYGLNPAEIRFLLHPIMYLQTTDVYAAELYPVWDIPSIGNVDPDTFLSILERYGYAKQLGELFFKKICILKRKWKNTPFEHLSICIYLSAKFLLQSSALTYIDNYLHSYHICASEIIISVGEHEFQRDNKELNSVLQQLRDLGFLIAINAFGSAASLQVLRTVPSQILIFHKEMLSRDLEDDKTKFILKNIVSLGIDLHQLIIGQAIENIHQAETLMDYGVQCGSGTLYGNAVTESEFISKYQNNLFCIQKTNPVSFLFHNNLYDQSRKYAGCFSGDNLTYTTGITHDLHSIVLPGGDIGKNIVFLPKSVLPYESYTISLWIKPVESQPWTSALYIIYQDGFMSLIPNNGHSEFVFRIKDDRAANEWYDIICRQALPDHWSHICAIYHSFTGVSKLYFNGIMVGSREGVPNLKLVENIYIGGDEYQSSFKGLISGLEFYHYPMTADQIHELYVSFQKQPSFQGSEGKK